MMNLSYGSVRQKTKWSIAGLNRTNLTFKKHVEVDDVDRYYIYDVANNLLAEADENKHIRYFVHGSGLSQMIQGVANQQQSYTYHYSANGHTLAMTDDQEAVLNQYAYSPYGRILGETETVGLEQPFKYVGQHGVQHEQGEIYYMRARYYDAEIGRFIKEDPIGFEGGLNVSLYVGGNPVVGIDPSGLLTEVEMSCLCELAQEENADIPIPNFNEIVQQDLGGITAGQYDYEKDRVIIDDRYSNESFTDGAELYNTYVHEGLHRQDIQSGRTPEYTTSPLRHMRIELLSNGREISAELSQCGF